MSHTTKKWEVFPGRNKFCLDGRIIMGPDVTVFYINVFLIVGTTLLFLIFDCPYLTREIGIYIPIITVIFFVFVMSTLLRTSFTDPGIIPRATADEAMYIEKQIKISACGEMSAERPPPRTKEVIIKGQSVKLKYCFTCKIFRPPRASHCSLCDNCVDHFDHHCPWVGNCVGRRNYRYFYLFTVTLSFYIAFVFICTCTHLYLLSEKRMMVEAIADSPASVIVILITFFSCWSVFGLAGFHTYLAASNQTTNEDIKGSFSNKRGGSNRNPYSFGNGCLNCCYVLCGPFPSSLIDSEGFVIPDAVHKNIIQERQPIKFTNTTYAPSNANGLPYQMVANGVKSHPSINHNTTKQHSSVISNQQLSKDSPQKSSPSLSYGLYYDSNGCDANNDTSDPDNDSSFFILDRNAFNRHSVPHYKYKTESNRHRLSLPVKLVPYSFSEFFIGSPPLTERYSAKEGVKRVALNPVAFVSPRLTPVHDASRISKQLIRKKLDTSFDS